MGKDSQLWPQHIPFSDGLLETDLPPSSLVFEGVDEDKAETLLGLFTYDVDGMIAQTFHVQVWQVHVGRMAGRKDGLSASLWKRGFR